MRPIVRLTLMLTVCAAPALADVPPPRIAAILDAGSSGAALRARLMAFADSAAAAHAPALEGEALSYAGQSYQRAGLVDSAIICHRRAFDALLTSDELLALVDELLYRRTPADLREAGVRLEWASERSPMYPTLQVAGRLAWTRFLAGHPDSAAALFRPIEAQLLGQSEWRYRMGAVALARKEYRQAVDLLMPVAERSRGTDEDATRMLEQAGNALNVLPRIREEVSRAVLERDQPEVALAGELGGQLLNVPASDGFPLGGLAIPAGLGRRPVAHGRRGGLAAILLLASRDTVGSADSLVSALRRHGITSLILYPRGSGSSVGPSCPSPAAWFNREDELQARTARDVRDAFGVLARRYPVDTTRYVVAGVGAMAPAALAAAAADRRVRALLLVSPTPAAVEVGASRALAARLRLPTFFEVASEEYVQSHDPTEVLYQAGNRGASRVVDASVPGRGYAHFRADPTLAARFLSWLDATLRPAAAPRRAGGRAAPPPTRPSARRPG